MKAAAFQLDRPAPGTLGVSGVLSFDTAAAALDAIGTAMAAEPVARLDLAGVVRSDSAGLACVLAAQAEARRLGRAIGVENMPAGMRALAQVCEVDALVG
ncbi:STAS domain-containing protein [Frateuria terrea]|uniref:Phospholipid transport system transporter-binding protein n=1 Tax=Frateuria terrea TaxID=529704 RepID=A0A1H6RVN5_9GAMM|nr:STAS domain-containing protein [Frateuria terrea]SEI59789.1 phospholipid transport system transporter-binding protein [Frateuria terrea]SFP21749.1 phospholipid transport system transporter-binding protein [Frateuria terrea]